MTQSSITSPSITLPSIAAPRYIYVHSSAQLSEHLQRVYFSSDDFSDFPLGQNGAHIKLFFPEHAHQKPPLPLRNEHGRVIWPDGKKPLTRTYSIRDFLAEQQLLVIDFVRHADFGIAADWAIHAQPGDTLGLAGPGGPSRFNPQAKYWVFIADLSALAMLAASLEQLPTDAHGEVWIELENAADRIELIYPAAMQIHWLINSPDVEQQIACSLEQLDWDAQQISVTLAGENSRVVALRRMIKEKYRLHKDDLYAVPYWKKGHSEEAYHQQRHQVMDQDI